MKKQVFFLILFSSLGCMFGFGQNDMTSKKYERVSLTVIYIDDPSPDPNGGLSGSVRNFVENTRLIGPKFNDHSLASKYIRIDIPNYTAENRITSPAGSDTRAIRDFLAGSDFSRQIVAKWFSRKPDGTLSMDLIGQRGLYNASDNDYLTATASQRQLGSLKDQGEKLLKLSYVLFINFSDIQYKEPKSSPGKGDYCGSGRGFLYKLAWNDSVSATFYTNLWIADGDAEAVKADKKRTFDSTVFPMEFVRDVNYTVAPSLIVLSTDKRSDEEKRTALLNTLYENLLLAVENRVSDFQVRQNLISSKPIGATIGLKEGVYVDQRFFVYENIQRKNQEIEKRRRAVIRAKSVADNEKVTEGKSNPTTFYQIAGGKVDHFGMFIEQKNDRGIAVTASVLSGEMGGVNLTLAYNLSRTLGKTMKMKTIPTGVYLFADLALDQGNYEVYLPDYYTGNGIESFLFTRVSLGLTKDFYFLHHFQLSPRIGYGIENTNLFSKGESSSFPDGLSITGDHILAGVSLGMNLLHNVQLIGGANYYIPLGNNFVTAGTSQPVTIATGWTSIFNYRTGLTVFGGLRILL